MAWPRPSTSHRSGAAADPLAPSTSSSSSSSSSSCSLPPPTASPHLNPLPPRRLLPDTSPRPPSLCRTSTRRLVGGQPLRPPAQLPTPGTPLSSGARWRRRRGSWQPVKKVRAIAGVPTAGVYRRRRRKTVVDMVALNFF